MSRPLEHGDQFIPKDFAAPTFDGRRVFLTRQTQNANVGFGPFRFVCAKIETPVRQGVISLRLGANF